MGQKFYVVVFYNDGSAVEDDQGEKDGPARCVGASVIGHWEGGRKFKLVCPIG
jgi:hypothetical protein